MAGWNDGYIHDVSYTTGFYRETAPGWIAVAAQLLGHHVPDLTRPFRWAEFGCGNGLSATIFAAANPAGEYHGFDFNPAHIEHARRLAGRAGLANVHFHEMSFEQMAEAQAGALPQFDMMVAHGIWSWVSPDARTRIAEAAGRFLAPGGLLYVSYNALSGWSAMLPVQQFMREYARAHPGPSVDTAAAALGAVRELVKSDAGFFQAHPGVAARLEPTAGMDAKYLAHEYLNANWDPTSHIEVADVLAEAKLGYIGSATLIENIDAVVMPAGIAKIVAATPQPRLKELLRDLASNKSFRRDLYRRGTEPPLGGEHREALDRLALVGTGREREPNIQIPTGIGQLGLKMDIYAPILARLAEGPMTIAELRQTPVLSKQPLSETLQAAAFMMTGNLAHPVVQAAPDPAAVAACRALNAAIGAYNAAGGTISVLASPVTGSGFTADWVETVILPELAAGRMEEGALVDHVLACLAATGRQVVREGKPVTDPALARTEMTGTVGRILADRMALYRRLGVLT